MRTVILLLGLCTHWAHAQSWFNDQAEWHFGYANSGVVIGYVHGTIGGDTILDGLVARKLQLHRFAAFIGTTQVYEENMRDEVLYHADGIVWVHVSQQAAFDTLYNMNALPGDRWRLAELPNEGSPCGPESYMLVTDTGTTTRFGPELRWLAVDVHYSGEWGFMVQDTIVERIGTLDMYILPHDLCLGMADGSQGGLILCYSDAEVEHVWDPETPCDRTLGMRTSSITEPLHVFPNPCTTSFRCSASWAPSTTLVLLDATGRIVRTWAVSNGQQEFSTTGIAPGNYLLRPSPGGMIASTPLSIVP